MLELSHITRRLARTQWWMICALRYRSIVYLALWGKRRGKTTTMKMILGLIRADAGEIRVNGEMVCFGKSSTNRFVGYLPDVPEFYGFLTAEEYLLLCAEISGISKEERRGR